jgi:hypothetical protein
VQPAGRTSRTLRHGPASGRAISPQRPWKYGSGLPASSINVRRTRTIASDFQRKRWSVGGRGFFGVGPVPEWEWIPIQNLLLGRNSGPYRPNTPRGPTKPIGSRAARIPYEAWVGLSAARLHQIFLLGLRLGGGNERDDGIVVSVGIWACIGQTIRLAHRRNQEDCFPYSLDARPGLVAV